MDTTAEEEKVAGNTEYKKRNFEKALEHYRKAIELDGTNMAYRTNVAAVYFEEKKYKECISECLSAIEIGRENCADYKLIAKAYCRMGNAARKLGDIKTAKTYYEKSLSEHATPETQAQMTEVEAIIKEDERKKIAKEEERKKIEKEEERKKIAKEEERNKIAKEEERKSSEAAAAKPNDGIRFSYPTSSKNKKDWDKIEKEIEKEFGDDEDVNNLFAKIFSSGDENTKRAMMKSMQESGGTVLSTNWDEVGKKTVECSPPDGMEWKKWDASARKN